MTGDSTASCELCRCGEFDGGELVAQFINANSSDGAPDYLAFKRRLERKYDLSISLSDLRNHLHNHGPGIDVGPGRVA